MLGKEQLRVQGGVIKSRRPWQVFLETMAGTMSWRKIRFDCMKLGHQAGRERRVFQANGTLCTKPGFES